MEVVIAKLPRVIDLRYLRWCRAQPCAFCERPPRSQAHHVIHKAMGGATRRDDYAVPACNNCHMRCHNQRVVENDRPLPRIPRVLQFAAAEAHRERYLRERYPTAPPIVPF